jgi:hypothetical protein
MNEPTLELLLVALLLGTLLCVVSLMFLRSRVQRSDPVHSALFSAGATFPYSMVLSLRAKYFLPWVRPPNCSQRHFVVSSSLWLARVGAYIAAAAFSVMIAVGFAEL